MDAFMNRFGGSQQRKPAQTSKPVQFTPADNMALALNEAKKLPSGGVGFGAAGFEGFSERFAGQHLSAPIHFYVVDGKPGITLVFDKEEHIYFLKKEDGSLEPQDGVTTIVHIIDKSKMLTPWAAKMVCEKAIRLMPTEAAEDGTTMVKRITAAEFFVLMQEAKTAPKDRLDEAGDIGNLAHNCLEDSIRASITHNKGVVDFATNVPSDERASNCVDAGLKWMRAHNVRWIATERKIYSRKHKYAGTMDGLCVVDSCSDLLCCKVAFKDRLTIADWKSSNQLNIEYLYQTAAYQHAVIEEFGNE